MLIFGLGMGGLLFAIGMITFIFAPRVGPNPFFGVRVGYSYANREVWDRTNRFGGALISIVGVFVGAMALVLKFVNLPMANGIMVITGAMIVSMLASTVWMFAYARNLAHGTVIVRELGAVRFRWLYLTPVLVTFGLLVAVALYFYPALPTDRLATHFGLNYQPDGWSTRDGFLAQFLGMAGLCVVLNVVVVFIATREPVIAFGRWGSSWRLDPARGLVYLGAALSVGNLVMLAALWDIVWFNTRGVHAFPLSFLLWLVIPITVIFVGMFFLLARRDQ